LEAVVSAAHHAALGKYSRDEFRVLTGGNLGFPNLWRNQPFALGTLPSPPAGAPADGVIGSTSGRLKTRIAVLLDEQTHS